MQLFAHDASMTIMGLIVDLEAHIAHGIHTTSVMHCMCCMYACMHVCMLLYRLRHATNQLHNLEIEWNHMEEQLVERQNELQVLNRLEHHCLAFLIVTILK